MKIVTAEQMRDLEAATIERGISTEALMENAGLEVAKAARRMLGGQVRGDHITILVGPGNNGGDGLVTARHLNDWGVRVHVVLCGSRTTGDINLERLVELAVDIAEIPEDGNLWALERALGASKLVIDAILGIGKSRAISGTIRTVLEHLQTTKRRDPDLLVLALDIPSGLDVDSGACDSATPSADVTVTLGYPKVGLFIFPGASKVGRIETVDIGIPPDLAEPIEIELSAPSWIGTLLPRRPLNANKGTFGRVLVVAGSPAYIGAATLACAGAIRGGAGLVTLATPKSLVPMVAAALPEVTFLPLEESEWGIGRGAEAAQLLQQELSSYTTLLVGCGLGQAAETVEMVQRLLLRIPETVSPRIVIDADAINILAKDPNWARQIQADAVLTPHPGEMRRLTDLSVDEIQTNRLNAAQMAAASWRKTVLLKGANSIITTPEGRVRINPFVNPALATAGTGDVLAGLLAGLLAQGLSSFHAAAAAAYIHGAAGEALVEQIGDTGVAASDLLIQIPKVIRDLRNERTQS